MKHTLTHSSGKNCIKFCIDDDDNNNVDRIFCFEKAKNMRTKSHIGNTQSKTMENKMAAFTTIYTALYIVASVRARNQLPEPYV